MVRRGIFFLICITSLRLQAADEFYLSSAQKAYLSITLQSILATRAGTLSNYRKAIESEIKAVEPKPAFDTEIRSFKEFLEIQKSQNIFSQKKLSQLSAADLVPLLTPQTYRGSTPSIQRKIDYYFELKSQTENHFLIEGLQTNAELVKAMPLVSVKELQAEINAKISAYVAEFTDKMKLGNQNRDLVLLTKLITAYFQVMPFEQKVEIFYRVVQLPFNASASDVFLTLLQNSGPQLQKLIQITGRSADIPKKFQAIFQKLESQVKPVPWWEVKQVLEAEIDLSELSYFEQKPLGVGTMAQTHRAQMKRADGSTQSFVIRFIKPDSERLLQVDYEILKKVSVILDEDPEIQNLKIPSLKRFIDDVHASVLEELDLEKTVRNQNKGQKIYENSQIISYSGQKNEIVISVPDTTLIGKKSKLMMQELVFGKKPASELKEYREMYPGLYPLIAEKIAEKWIEQAFFKTGFFHADLHQGNILVQVLDDHVQVELLDFGMVGELSPELRKNVLGLTLGLKTSNAEVITDCFIQLSRTKFNNYQRQDLLQKVQQKLLQIKSGTAHELSLSDWTDWMLEQGVDMKYEFIKLNRGLIAINSLLKDSGSLLTTEEVAKKIALQNKSSILTVISENKSLRYSDLLAFGLKSLTEKKQTARVTCRFLFE